MEKKRGVDFVKERGESKKWLKGSQEKEEARYTEKRVENQTEKDTKGDKWRRRRRKG